jgi:hypothetical protein
MENFDLILATSIAVILFTIFIVATLVEFDKINKRERTKQKKSAAETTNV